MTPNTAGIRAVGWMTPSLGSHSGHPLAQIPRFLSFYQLKMEQTDIALDQGGKSNKGFQEKWKKREKKKKALLLLQWEKAKLPVQFIPIPP